MMCLSCGNEEFDLNTDADIEQYYKDMHFYVKTPAMVCNKCGWKTVTDEQIDELCKRTQEEYKKRKSNQTGALGPT
jgi:uncharacterized OB-fold protein